MRVIVQRVLNASCSVDNKLISKINKGYMLLVGFCATDSINVVTKMARKIANLRICEDENKKMNKNIIDTKGEILSISQFTLYANPYTGNRPSFTEAMHPFSAKPLYDKFNEILNNDYNIKTYEGSFGSDMKLDIVCDGPVTITLEYEEVA